jgi:hypothetical protein
LEISEKIDGRKEPVEELHKKIEMQGMNEFVNVRAQTQILPIFLLGR